MSDVCEAVSVEKSVKLQVDEPPLFQIIVLNDDYTPMDFVVNLFQYFFRLSVEESTQLMLTIHQKGLVGIGQYSKDVAETKSAQINAYAQQNEYPLLTKVQKIF